MPESISSKHPEDEHTEGIKKHDGEDAVKRFHEKNRLHKRKLFQRFGEGAAMYTGKEVAKELDFKDQLMKFIEWLQDLL